MTRLFAASGALGSTGWIMAIYLIVPPVWGASTLAEAAKNKDFRTVESLLRQHVDVNAPLGDGSTALHWAAHEDDLSIANLLLHAGANPNATTDLEVTPLLVAAIDGHTAIASRLLEAGANPNAAMPSGETALMAAARTGNLDLAKALLVRGANVNVKEAIRGQTPLMWAVAQKHPLLVGLLIVFGADIRARSTIGKSLVYTGVPTVQAGRNAAALVKTIDTGGSTPLLFAARTGDIECAKLLLDAGADPNDAAPDGTSALVMASRSGNGGVASLLLTKTADVNSTSAGYSALHAAVLRDDPDLVNDLLIHGADPNATVSRPTPVVREGQDFVIPSTLVGATPFFLAAKFAEGPIMRALLKAGADPTFKMKDGTTPLMSAAGVGWVFQADRRNALNVGPPTGEDEKRGLEAVQIALASGGDVNLANQAGDTALHGAAAKGFTNIVRFLIQNGAKVDVKNRRGQTPLSVTPEPRGPGTTADLLRKSGTAIPEAQQP